jgi:exopolysaccharide/PEP-CTERM locus tyrosine autokinase
MSRIEDALQKLQSRSSRPPASPVPRLATLEPRQHAYAGRRIAVDSAQLRANGLLALDSEERRLAEQYRAIKRPLLRNAEPGVEPPLPRGNLLMVASALPGEGKTFTCVNLCLSIARERDWTVVLVDGDCSKPHLTRLFAAENEPGLIDLLRVPALNFDALVMPTDVPGLSLLPAGSRDPRASELLASKRMDELCEVLSSGDAGRMVVFDSSPLLMTTEAIAIAANVGQIAMVVRANETRREAVMAALEKLDATKAIACILNRNATETEHAEGYGYYGYYGHEDTPPDNP